jgi:hypothetical protein
MSELRIYSDEDFNTFFHYLSQTFFQLIRINFNNFNLSMYEFPRENFAKLVQKSCTNHLVELDVSNCYFFSDHCLEILMNNCNYLEHLNISSCYSITGSCFMDLGHETQLKMLKIDCCTEVKT